MIPYFKISAIAIALSVLTLASCDKKSSCDNAVKGTLKDLTGLDGCGMVIELKNGDKLEPSNLSDFNIELNDGQKVWVEYHSIWAASICMVGEAVEIDCLGER